MSTFKGLVHEFPEIRIDYFRSHAGRTPPLACFLSHVHSDHLQGLESLKSPFVYCSAVTRELLLRLERYPHRMNFAKGILEVRRQHYKHLKSLIKTIPLNTPTEIELRPQNLIRVTLLDANHCAGAVMFLIENHENAILYTGDIRSEPWLDKIYLDTTFASKNDRHRVFPTKADGLSELLTKISKYPASTVFHFHAWTLGYEEVWIALASALRSQIHVDEYKMRLYNSLNAASRYDGSAHDGAALCGFQCGNQHQPGRFTSDPKVRIHSCEPGINCSGLESADVVWITPIIARSSDGTSIPEAGAGGGGDDLKQAHELELQDANTAVELIKLCLENIRDQQALEKTLDLISTGLKSANKTVTLDALKLARGSDSISLKELALLLSNGAAHDDSSNRQKDSIDIGNSKNTKSQKMGGVGCQLPKRIQFPYARHSSYNELCHLISVFRPADVYPCTIDEASWTWDVSIECLFGSLCSGTSFAHDREMLSLNTQRSEFQSANVTSVEVRGPSNLDALSQKSGDLEETDEDLCLINSKQSLSASRVRKFKQHYPSTMVARDSQKNNTRMKVSPSNVRHYRRRMHSFKNSFGGWLNQPDCEDSELTSESERVYYTSLPIPLVDDNEAKDTNHQAVRGTTKRPVEFPDVQTSGPRSDNKEHDSDRIVTRPNIHGSQIHTSGAEHDTQISIWGSAFESQASPFAGTKTRPEQVQHRKDAYKAAKGRSELSWENDHGLISSNGGHGIEETEL
ncbi:hypothetical protein MMC29_003042 [Sticta canariensis]|nr:hypothetical protein [Sticta canariensis]